MDTLDSANKIVTKYARFIPIKKWRHGFRDSLMRTLHSSRNAILGEYARLVTPTNDRELQKSIFKQNVRLVEVEIASFCNRRCWFCPNSIVDRYNNKVELSEEVYLKIINSLAEIDYSGMLNFHRFNEPLANKELVLRRISQAKAALSHARLGIFTNGDYLDRNYLDALRDSGVSYMIMSYYFDKNKEFDVEGIIKPAINKMAEKLKLNYREIMNDGREYAVSFIYEGINIMYRSYNPRIFCNNRGDSIKDERIARMERDFPCYYPLREVFVDYNGLVMPCCNTRSDIPSHKSLVLGDMGEDDLFSLFMSDKFIKLRKDLMSNTPKYDACKYCSYNASL